jgi:serine/threonine protein kinase
MDTAAQVDPEAMLGRVVGGKYELVAKLGSGGMGAVFRARHRELGTTVAVKLMLVHDPEHVQRFEREAATLARIDHRSVVRVLDYGRDDGGYPYLVMEHVTGVDLQRLVETQGALPLERVVALGADVLAGLAAVHETGIVHRDMKPSNVLVTRARDDEGRTVELAKICDFGIAILDDAASSDAAPLTRTGYVVGTPEYMAPEQALGQGVSPRTDLYATGVMLFELATACRPYGGATPVEIAVKHVSAAVPRPSSLVPLPEAFDAFCMQVLSKDPAARFADARAMRRALLDVLRVATEVSSAATVATRRVSLTPARPDTPRTQEVMSFDAPAHHAEEDEVDLPPLVAPTRPALAPWIGGAAALVLLVIGLRTLGGDEPAPRSGAARPEEVTMAASGSPARAAPRRESATDHTVHLAPTRIGTTEAPPARALSTANAPAARALSTGDAPSPRALTTEPAPAAPSVAPSRALTVRSNDPVEAAGGGTSVAAATPRSGALAPGGDPRAGVAAATLPNSAPTVADALREVHRALGSVTRVQAGPGLADSDVAAQGERAKRALEQCTMRGAGGLARGNLGETVARLQVSPEGKVVGVAFDGGAWPDGARACAQRALVGMYLPHALPSATSAIIGLGLVLE